MSQQDLLDQIQEAANITLSNAQEAKNALAEAKAISLKINNEQAVSINNSKEAIRLAIINKGQSCSSSVPFDKYAEKIMAIEGGTSSGDSSSSGSSSSSNFVDGFNGNGKFLYRLGVRGTNNLSMLKNVYNFDNSTKYDYIKLKNRKFKSFSISNSGKFALMIGTDGNLYTINYGDNAGSCLNFSSIECCEPTLVDSSGNWKKVYIDEYNSFIFNEDDELYVCGTNSDYKFGLDHNNTVWRKTKIEYNGITKWEKVFAYGNCAFYLSKDGRLFCSGRNNNGVLGLDIDNDDHYEHQLHEITVDGVSAWKDFSLYDVNACAVSSDGQLYVWGNNECNQLEVDYPDPFDLKYYHSDYNSEILENATVSFTDDKQYLTISNSNMSEFNGTFEQTSYSGIAKYLKEFTSSNGNEISAYIEISERGNDYYIEFYRNIKYPDDYRYYHEFIVASADPYNLAAMESESFSSESLSISEDKNTIILSPDFGNTTTSCEHRFYDYPLSKKQKDGVYAFYESDVFGCEGNIKCHFIEIIKNSENSYTWKIGMIFRDFFNGKDNEPDYYGNMSKTPRPTNKPKRIGSDKSWKKACFGEKFLIALTEGGELYSCGQNSDGRTAQNKTSEYTSTLTKIGSQSNWKNIFILEHSAAFLAIDNENKAYFSGKNADKYGGRGNGSRSTPTWYGLKFDDSVEFTNTFDFFLANEDIDYTKYQLRLHELNGNRYKLIIPNDVTCISKEFFNNYSYRYIFIPNEVLNIDANAFTDKSGSDSFKLFFECTKEDVMTLDGYPWGLDSVDENYENKHFIFNAEFEKIPEGGEINYYIQNEFPDGYEKTI